MKREHERAGVKQHADSEADIFSAAANTVGGGRTSLFSRQAVN